MAPLDARLARVAARRDVAAERVPEPVRAAADHGGRAGRRTGSMLDAAEAVRTGPGGAAEAAESDAAVAWVAASEKPGSRSRASP